MIAHSIDTEYAGCRFRSRLEARWAVFFDQAGIEWLYEPERYLLSNGRTYLPDFYLPEADAWVEVKGADANLDIELMYLAAAELPRRPAACSAQLVILGAIPRAEGEPFHEHGHDWLWASPQSTIQSTETGALLIHRWAGWFRFGQWRKAGGLWHDPPMVGGTELTTKPCLSAPTHVDDAITAAYAYARAARFEHGDAAVRPPRNHRVVPVAGQQFTTVVPFP